MAAVGDSLTTGYGVATPYSLRLQAIYGDQHWFVNLGQNGATYHPRPFSSNVYRASAAFAQLQTSMPFDLVVMMLGTNDAKTSVFSSNSTFVNAAVDLINDVFRTPSQPAVFLLVPPTTQRDSFGIRKATLDAVVAPLLRGPVASAFAARPGGCDAGAFNLLDLSANPLFNPAAHISGDGVHLNDAGQQLLASLVQQALQPCLGPAPNANFAFDEDSNATSSSSSGTSHVAMTIGISVGATAVVCLVILTLCLAARTRVLRSSVSPPPSVLSAEEEQEHVETGSLASFGSESSAAPEIEQIISTVREMYGDGPRGNAKIANSWTWTQGEELEVAIHV